MCIWTMLFLASALASGQQYGLGILLGASQYKGDMADYSEGLYENLRPVKGVQFNYEIHRRISFSASYIHTYMMGYDIDADALDRRMRNLHFKSSLDELSVTFNFYPISFITSKEYRLKPYIKTGIGVFLFNPKAEYESEWHSLQPLHTEGQGMPLSGLKPYNLVDISYPFGVGLEYNLCSFLKLRVEISPRKTFTDYLDDVSSDYYDLDNIRKFSSDIAAKMAYRAEDWSLENTAPEVDGIQRGNPENKDWYIIHQFSMLYVFGKKTKPEEVTPPPATL
ncbi:MAG: hypothetical protein IPN29_13575 [Saprospiraceae bacterium]|nr:hypothetical protein [Saprospiraceae bacterium]